MDDNHGGTGNAKQDKFGDQRIYQFFYKELSGQ